MTSPYDVIVVMTSLERQAVSVYTVLRALNHALLCIAHARWRCDFTHPAIHPHSLSDLEACWPWRWPCEGEGRFDVDCFPSILSYACLSCLSRWLLELCCTFSIFIDFSIFDISITFQSAIFQHFIVSSRLHDIISTSQFSSHFFSGVNNFEPGNDRYIFSTDQLHMCATGSEQNIFLKKRNFGDLSHKTSFRKLVVTKFCLPA